jgi:hypothetical protein
MVRAEGVTAPPASDTHASPTAGRQRPAVLLLAGRNSLGFWRFFAPDRFAHGWSNLLNSAKLRCRLSAFRRWCFLAIAHATCVPSAKTSGYLCYLGRGRTFPALSPE